MFDPEVAAALGDVEFSLDEIFSEAAAKDEARREHRRTKARECYASDLQNKRAVKAKWRDDNKEWDEYHRNWRRDNRDKVKTHVSRHREKYPERRLDQYMRREFGIGAFEYRSMEYIQDGVCLMCKKANPHGNNLSVDHCHATLKIRGLLCVKCNAVAGMGDDDPGLVLKIATYLGEGGYGL